MKKIYISFDGKVFQNSIDCTEYECSKIEQEKDFDIYDYDGNRVYLNDEIYNTKNNLGQSGCILVLKSQNAVSYFSGLYDFEFKTTGIYCRFFSLWIPANDYIQNLLKKINFIKSIQNG